jgi:hypothetical protein
MVSDLYLFRENANEIANRSYGATKRWCAGTRHFRTDLNISSFDGNANPAGADDESISPVPVPGFWRKKHKDFSYL